MNPTQEKNGYAPELINSLINRIVSNGDETESIEFLRRKYKAYSKGVFDAAFKAINLEEEIK